MDKVIKWGPFLLKIELVAIFISGLMGYFLVRHYLKREMGDKKDQILNMMGNTLYIGIGIWKLSLILINPVSVWNNPVVLLYFSGGYRGWMIAILVIFVYLVYQSKKQSLPLSKFFQLYGLGFSTAYLAYYYIYIVVDRTDTGFHFVQMILSLAFIWWFFRKGTANQAFQGVVWFGIGQVLVQYLQPYHVAIWLGFSRYQLIFLVVVLLGFLGPLIEKKQKLV